MDGCAAVRQDDAVTRGMNEVVELETVAHWWCRRCGRWEVCDDADLCVECGYMVAGRRRRSPRRSQPLGGDGASGTAQA
jgi:ribosomal protein L37E